MKEQRLREACGAEEDLEQDHGGWRASSTGRQKGSPAVSGLGLPSTLPCAVLSVSCWGPAPAQSPPPQPVVHELSVLPRVAPTSLAYCPHRVPHVGYGHCEVSPLTTEDPRDAHDSPSEPDPTLAASDLPTELPPSPQPCLSASSSRPDSQVSGFDFNGPYLGPPHSLSLPDLVGQEAPTQRGMSLKPLPPGSLEYLCLPAGGKGQLVPLAQVMKQGQATGVERKPCPGAQGSPSLESGAGPAPSAPGLMVGGQGQKDSPIALPTASGGPEDSIVASGYVTTADLALPPPKGALSASQIGPLGLPSDRNQSLNPGLATGLPVAPPPMKPEFQDYVELPATMGQSPKSLCVELPLL